MITSAWLKVKEKKTQQLLLLFEEVKHNIQHNLYPCAVESILTSCVMRLTAAAAEGSAAGSKKAAEHTISTQLPTIQDICQKRCVQRRLTSSVTPPTPVMDCSTFCQVGNSTSASGPEPQSSEIDLFPGLYQWRTLTPQTSLLSTSLSHNHTLAPYHYDADCMIDFVRRCYINHRLLMNYCIDCLCGGGEGGFGDTYCCTLLSSVW